MKLYGRRLSPYVERVCLQVAHKGLEDEIRLTGIPGDDLKSPEYLAISPLGKMPLLEDGDFRLPESSVILEYIEEKFPEPATLPADPVQRARVRLIVTCLDLYVLPPLFFMLGQIGERDRDAAAMEEKLAETVKGLDLIEGLIDDGGYLIGETFSMADCAGIPAFFLLTRYLAGFGAEPITGRPRLEGWLAAQGTSELFRASEAAQERALADFLKRMGLDKEAG